MLRELGGGGLGKDRRGSLISTSSQIQTDRCLTQKENIHTERRLETDKDRMRRESERRDTHTETERVSDRQRQTDRQTEKERMGPRAHESEFLTPDNISFVLSHTPVSAHQTGTWPSLPTPTPPPLPPPSHSQPPTCHPS